MAPSRLSAHAVAYRETTQRGSAIGEARRSSANTCLSRLDNVPSWAVWKRGVVDVVTWVHQQRALRRLLNDGRAIGHCTLVSGLSSVLEGIANTKVSEGSVASAEGASATSPRPDGAASYTGCTVEMAQLPNAFWKQLLSPVFLNHVQHEAVVGDCSEGGGIGATLRTLKILFRLLFRPRLGRSPRVGHRRRCWG